MATLSREWTTTELIPFLERAFGKDAGYREKSKDEWAEEIARIEGLVHTIPLFDDSIITIDRLRLALLRAEPVHENDPVETDPVIKNQELCLKIFVRHAFRYGPYRLMSLGTGRFPEALRDREIMRQRRQPFPPIFNRFAARREDDYHRRHRRHNTGQSQNQVHSPPTIHSPPMYPQASPIGYSQILQPYSPVLQPYAPITQPYTPYAQPYVPFAQQYAQVPSPYDPFAQPYGPMAPAYGPYAPPYSPYTQPYGQYVQSMPQMAPNYNYGYSIRRLQNDAAYGRQPHLNSQDATSAPTFISGSQEHQISGPSNHGQS